MVDSWEVRHDPSIPRWEVVTKIDEVVDQDAAELAATVDESVATSQRRLGLDVVDTICIHNFDMYRAHGGAAWKRLLHHRDSLGTVRRCGVSLATVDEAIACLADDDVQHIQLPLNLLDYRWRAADFRAAMARRSDVTIHARSAFLQGTLINDASLWPEWAQEEGWPARVLEPLDGLVSSLGRKSRADLCIAYARGLSFVTHVLIGMRSVEQLHENLSLFEDCAPLTAEEVAVVEAEMPMVSERLVSPWLWSDAGWEAHQQAAAASKPRL